MTRDPLLQACVDDPWALSADQRQVLMGRCSETQERCEALLAPWVERADRVAGTPAFLLDTEAYAGLRDALACTAPDIGARDQAQRFVDQFAEWGVGAVAPR